MTSHYCHLVWYKYKESTFFSFFSKVWNRKHEFMKLLYVLHTWSELLMGCINIFLKISSGNLSYPLITISGVSYGIWQFWLFSTGLLSRGLLFWYETISLIWFSIQSSPLWSILPSGKFRCSLIPSESWKKSFSCVLLYFFSVLYHYCSSMWPTNQHSLSYEGFSKIHCAVFWTK